MFSVASVCVTPASWAKAATVSVTVTALALTPTSVCATRHGEGPGVRSGVAQVKTLTAADMENATVLYRHVPVTLVSMGGWVEGRVCVWVGV